MLKNVALISLFLLVSNFANAVEPIAIQENEVVLRTWCSPDHGAEEAKRYFGIFLDECEELKTDSRSTRLIYTNTSRGGDCLFDHGGGKMVAGYKSICLGSDISN